MRRHARDLAPQLGPLQLATIPALIGELQRRPLASRREQIRSEVADIKNVGEGRWGGAITAAKFLEEFVAGKPWVHLDIAGPAFLESSKPYLDSGATGYGVRTLVEVARTHS